MLTLLTGCASSGVSKFERTPLAAIPADLKICFDRLVARPAGTGPLTEKDIAALIGALKKSEEAKAGCGKRLIDWYETQANVMEESK
jgi:hypothetical protein